MKPLALTLRPGQALERMLNGAALVHIHSKTPSGRHWFVGDGAVDDETASKIINRPDVVGQHDGLFPQHDQTFLMKVSGHKA